MPKPSGYYTKDEKVHPIFEKHHHVRPISSKGKSLNVPKRTVNQMRRKDEVKKEDEKQKDSKVETEEEIETAEESETETEAPKTRVQQKEEEDQFQ